MGARELRTISFQGKSLLLSLIVSLIEMASAHQGLLPQDRHSTDLDAGVTVRQGLFDMVAFCCAGQSQVAAGL